MGCNGKKKGKLLGLLLAVLLLSNITYAEEVKLSKQDVEVDSAGAVFLLNKQPKTSGNEQHIKVTRCGLVFVANINGKVTVQDKEKK